MYNDTTVYPDTGLYNFLSTEDELQDSVQCKCRYDRNTQALYVLQKLYARRQSTKSKHVCVNLLQLHRAVWAMNHLLLNILTFIYRSHCC